MKVLATRPTAELATPVVRAVNRRGIDARTTVHDQDTAGALLDGGASDTARAITNTYRRTEHPGAVHSADMPRPSGRRCVHTATGQIGWLLEAIKAGE